MSVSNPLYFIQEPKHFHLPFESCGSICDGDLFLPEDKIKPPVVILTHGIGYARFIEVRKIIQFFLDNGIAVYVFDYRGYTFSEGKVRNLVIPAEQTKDILNAVKFIKTQELVDSEFIGLCGVSFSVGNVIRAAFADNSVKFSVGFIPWINPLRSAIKHPLLSVPLALGNLADFIVYPFTKKHLCFPMRMPNYLYRESVDKSYYPDYTFSPKITGRIFGLNIIEIVIKNIVENKSVVWNNLVPMRSVFPVIFSNPLKNIEKIDSKFLFIAGTNDELSSLKSLKRISKRMKDCEIITFDGGHFSLGTDENYLYLKPIVSDYLKREIL